MKLSLNNLLIEDAEPKMEALRDIEAIIQYMQKVREEITYGEINGTPSYLKASNLLLQHLIRDFGR